MSKHRKHKPSSTKRFIAVTAGLGALVGAGAVANAGTAGAQGWSASCNWEWPVSGSLSQGYHAGHDGVDFAVNVGTALHAPTSGTISVAGPNDPGGYERTSSWKRTVASRFRWATSPKHGSVWGNTSR